MLNDQEIENLRLFALKLLNEDFDKFDFEQEIDRSLTYWENLSILEDKIKLLLSNITQIKGTKKELKEQYEALIKEENKNKFSIISLFTKPKIIGMCANSNEGKTNLIFYFLSELHQSYNFSVYTYGLRVKYPDTMPIHSIEELEQIKNSIVILDEIFSLFDLDNRKVKSQIENTLRLIFHNNNMLLLCGLGENFKKFLSAKLHAVIFKKVTFRDMINGSSVKDIAMEYKGNEAGSKILNLAIDEALVYDGLHYHLISVPYFPEFDTKLKNVPIIVQKNVQKNNVINNVQKQ